MSRRVDPALRRQQVVEAAFRLLVAEGIGSVSLRKVADESGINVGSVRHYFGSHEDLLIAVAGEAGDRMGARLAMHPASALRGLSGTAAVAGLQKIVEDVLPLDADRREEAIVVTELVMASRTMPVFADMVRQMGEDLVAVLEEALAALGSQTPRTNAQHIAAFIGGLTVDMITPHGTGASIDACGLLRSFLTRLVTPGR
ncbi:TetR/AcrR family transcriptional regulator [Ancrocorticia populi]|uniref:TetR family transcriptional regulator n=1 Tax=Ancrocorticia populi TaxID=2175228 RepID=A0A2V1KB58_9ACTO|nr:TetR family transcriptional regulator C-terminal domain-containing protein [Ancrocorticia populi]PWF26585.1 TetR family transcriptional regulator [Ancrocorticia populi]